MAGIGSAPNGAPPAWNTYIAVENADAIVAKVEAAGGTSLLAPFDVGEAGRMAVFADPEGAAFRVWQAGEASGARARQRARLLELERPRDARHRRREGLLLRRSSAGSTRRSTSAAARRR